MHGQLFVRQVKNLALEKMGSNKSYVEKELARLQGILKKGSVEASKQDDLISRINVLKKFATTDGSAEDVKQEL